MSPFSLSEIGVVARILRGAAEAQILPRFRGLVPSMIRQKCSPLDLVTDANEAAEAAITAALQREFPSAVIGEEAAARDPARCSERWRRTNWPSSSTRSTAPRISPPTCRCSASWRQ